MFSRAPTWYGTASTVRFAKYEGLGNDFILLEDVAEIPSTRARQLCDRHRGIGADGVLLVNTQQPSMQVINADGSIAQMCGNGLRCVVWHLRRTGRLANDEVEVFTAAGDHRCWMRADEDVEVAMRPASFLPSDIPLQSNDRWLNRAERYHNMQLSITAVGVGNPHAVLFDAADERRQARLAIAQALQADERFTEGVNVGFAGMHPGGMQLEVYERGAGWTQACGTGACAAVAAAVETGRWERGRPCSVELPGGSLTITVLEDGAPIRMRGPARHVFDGSLPS